MNTPRAALLTTLLVFAALPTWGQSSLSPGDYAFTIEHGGYTREYELHVPAGYVGDPVPLVVDFHALGDNGMAQRAGSGFLRKSDEEGFLAAWPKGLERSWNVSGACCGFAAANDIDDVGFARAVVADIAARSAIDSARVYATGQSNGGGLTQRLGCEAADLFAGIAPAAFPLPSGLATECQPARPIPVVHFHGLNDNTVAYDGSLLLPGAVESHESWAAINQCTGSPVRILTSGNSFCDAYQECAGGAINVLCSVASGHWVYVNPDIDVADVAWDLLSPFALELSAAFDHEADGLEVRFTDQSAGATSWSWDFGDDAGTSTDQHPVYTYAAAGTYTVTLTVSDGQSSDSASANVTVAEGVAMNELYFSAAAAKAAGFEDSFWVTDATINNAGDSTATFAFWWLPRDQDNSAPVQSDPFTLGAGMSVVYTDLLGSVFGLGDGATGAVAVAADSRELLVMTRTYNQSDAGTFGQSLPGERVDQLIEVGERRRIVFFVQNDAYRSNLGLLNGTGAPITIRWERFTPDGSSVDTGSAELPPWGNTQLNQVFSEEAPVNGAFVDVWTETPGGAFTAYGSLLDNQTSDPTTILPR
jgi:polyhydroxybutyrate depolymerase